MNDDMSRQEDGISHTEPDMFIDHFYICQLFVQRGILINLLLNKFRKHEIYKHIF